MHQRQCLNRKAEGCMLESSDPSHRAHPQALKGRENNAGRILLRHLLTSACSTAPTAPSSLLLILLQGSLAEKGRKKGGILSLFPSFSPEPFSRHKQHLAHSRAQMAANVGCSRGSAFFVHCPPSSLFLFTQDSHRDPRLHPGHMVLTQSTSIHTPAGLITQAHTHKTHTHVHCCIGSLALSKGWIWLYSLVQVTVQFCSGEENTESRISLPQRTNVLWQLFPEQQCAC